jgi:hypothetical protein
MLSISLFIIGIALFIFIFVDFITTVFSHKGAGLMSELMKHVYDQLENRRRLLKGIIEDDGWSWEDLNSADLNNRIGDEEL